MIEKAIARALAHHEKHIYEVCVSLIANMTAPDFLASPEAKVGWCIAKTQFLEAIKEKAEGVSE